MIEAPDWAYRARLVLDSHTGGIRRAAERLAKRIRWRNWEPGRPTILCLDRALFAKDLAEMRKRCDINLPTVHVKPVKRPQYRWVPPRLRRQTYFTHDLDTELAHLKPHLEAFGRYFLEAAGRERPIHGVMAANVDYWQDDALKLACKAMGIPFLVLSRESYGIAEAREHIKKVYADAHFTFSGEGVAVASATCVEALRQTGSIGGAEVAATGWPRYDAWLELASPRPEERQRITLMSYASAQARQYAAGNFRDVLDVFMAAVRESRSDQARAGIEFFIKPKKPAEERDIHDLSPDIRRLGVKVDASSPLPELISGSRAVIGFNTLAMLEALLADVAVIVPSWGDALRPPERSLMHHGNAEDQAVAYFPRSVEEFRELLEAALAGKLPPRGSREERLRRFSRQSAVQEGESASLRVERFIRGLLAQRAGAGPRA